VRKIFNSLLLLLIAVPSGFSAAPAGLETLTLKTLPPVTAPAAHPPFNAPSTDRGSYDWTGLPAYIFTEQERLSPPITEAINRTKSTLDIALYNLQIEEAVKAMKRALESDPPYGATVEFDAGEGGQHNRFGPLAGHAAGAGADDRKRRRGKTVVVHDAHRIDH